jgi:hypothetical protein
MNALSAPFSVSSTPASFAARDILDFGRYDIAATMLALDRQVERGKVEGAAFRLEFRPD